MGELLEISWGMLASRIVTEQRTIVDVIDEWISNAAAILDAIDDDYELRFPLVDALHDMGKAIDLACENSVQVAELVNKTAGFRAGLNYQEAHLFLGAFPESLNVAFLGCPTITLPGSTVLSFVISTLEQYARDVQSRIEFRDESASHSEAGDEIVEEQRFLSLHVVPEAQTVERKLRNYDHIPPIRLADAEWPLFLAIYESRVTGLTTAQADAAFGSGGVSRRQAVTRLRKGIGVLGITIPDRQFRLAEKSPHES